MLELSCYSLALTLTQLSLDEVALVMETSHLASWGSWPCYKQDQHVLPEQNTAEVCLVASKDFVQHHFLLNKSYPYCLLSDKVEIVQLL